MTREECMEKCLNLRTTKNHGVTVAEELHSPMALIDEDQTPRIRYHIYINGVSALGDSFRDALNSWMKDWETIKKIKIDTLKKEVMELEGEK